MGSGGQSGALVFEDFEDGLGAWTTSGNASTVANPDGGHALLLEQTVAACGLSSASQDVAIPDDAQAVRFRYWGEGFTDFDNTTQAWLSLGFIWLVDLKNADPDIPTESTEVSYCVPESLRGGEHQLAIVARTQGDCSPPPAIQFFVDELEWVTTEEDCIEMTSLLD